VRCAHPAGIDRNETVARRLAEIEKSLMKHDGALRDLYQKIRPLLLPPSEPSARIGFHVKPMSRQGKGKPSETVSPGSNALLRIQMNFKSS